MTGVKAPARRDRAARTRRVILDAAHAEFLDRGYHGATIAARAGVATQTVSFVFHTKAELVSAVIDDQVLGPDTPTVPQQSTWWATITAAPTATAALQAFIAGAAPLLARAAPISEVVRAAALTDEEVRAIHQHHDELQLTAYRQVIDIVTTKGTLRDDLTPDTATDILLTLCGDSLWVQLTTDRGWPTARVVDWLVTTVPAALLAPDLTPKRAVSRWSCVCWG